jgi:hypothetical protein
MSDLEVVHGNFSRLMAFNGRAGPGVAGLCKGRERIWSASVKATRLTIGDETHYLGAPVIPVIMLCYNGRFAVGIDNAEPEIDLYLLGGFEYGASFSRELERVDFWIQIPTTVHVSTD